MSKFLKTFAALTVLATLAAASQVQAGGFGHGGGGGGGGMASAARSMSQGSSMRASASSFQSFQQTQNVGSFQAASKAQNFSAQNKLTNSVAKNLPSNFNQGAKINQAVKFNQPSKPASFAKPSGFAKANPTGAKAAGKGGLASNFKNYSKSGKGKSGKDWCSKYGCGCYPWWSYGDCCDYSDCYSYCQPECVSYCVPAYTAAYAEPLVSRVVRITNPVESQTSLGFTVDGTVYNLEAGRTQELPLTEGAIIEFDRGDSGEPGRYALSEGEYRFASTDKGWELYHTSDAPAEVASSEQ